MRRGIPGEKYAGPWPSNSFLIIITRPSLRLEIITRPISRLFTRTINTRLTGFCVPNAFFFKRRVFFGYSRRALFMRRSTARRVITANIARSPTCLNNGTGPPRRVLVTRNFPTFSLVERCSNCTGTYPFAVSTRHETPHTSSRAHNSTGRRPSVGNGN